MVKNLSKYILKRRTEDTSLMYDSVYLPSYNEILSESSSLLARRANPTDYAIANGAANLHFQKTLAGKKGCTYYYLRNERNKPNLTMVDAINTEGQYKQVSSSLESIGICPAMLLNSQEIASAVAVDENSFKIGEIKRKNEGYHTIQFGEFPQTVVDRKLQNILMDELSKGNLQKTGKKYVSCNLFYNSYNWEFEYNGQKYVYFPHTKPYDRKTFYSDGSQPTKSYDWFKVEPVVWKIKNWNSLPKAINPEGTGSHEYIDVSAESVILSGIPFHLDEKVPNSALWQNSTIRGYLNGINVNNIQENGDPIFRQIMVEIFLMKTTF